MKKGILILSGVMALMLLSFAPPQEKKAVRLKNGNYVLNHLKMENEDVKALQQLAEEMSQWLDENGKENEKKKKGDGRKQYEDLMAIFESKEGYKAYVASWHEDDTNVLFEEVYEDVISETLYHDKEADKESIAGFQEKVDAIMKPYL